MLHDNMTDDNQSSLGSSLSMSNNDESSSPDNDNTLPPALKRFRFLAEKLTSPSRDTTSSDGAGPEETVSASRERLIGQLNSYVGDLRMVSQSSTEQQSTDSFIYWQKRMNVYTELAPIAQNLVAAPASQAFIERIFSICGMLTAGRHNRMKKNT